MSVNGIFDLSNGDFPRDFIVAINRVRSEHYNLAACTARVNAVSDGKCKCYRESEDMNHIIWPYKLYDTQRAQLILLN